MREPSGFAAALGPAPKILVIELGGLGDNIHGLPALWMLRQNRPQARIDYMVGAGSAALFTAAIPWLDTVLAYDKQGLKSDLRWIARLRRNRYDAVIVSIASNHAVAMAGLSGARLRLARHADENKRWSWQPWLLTDVVEVPFHTEPMYRQRCRALQQAGFQGPIPGVGGNSFPLALDPDLRRAVGIEASDDRRYLHFSASATDDRRDLPLEAMVALWNGLSARLPAYPIVVSANGTARGSAKLRAILDRLSFTPSKVFDGGLDAPTFAAVVQGAVLHVGPDSGGLHVARLVGTRSVSWFRPNHHIANWLPDEAGHLAFTAPESRPDGLYGLESATLIDAAASLLPST
jgi:ADP-heptose:LPS heptosyltransferase